MIFKVIQTGILGLVICLATIGCNGGSDTTEIKPGEAPVFGSADDTGDQADYSCLVVLRSVSRLRDTSGMGGSGWVTTCSGTGIGGSSCKLIWFGSIDVDAQRLSEIQSVEVLFRTNQTGDNWYVAPASRGAMNGKYVKYNFKIDDYTPAEGMSISSLARTEIQLIPYVVTTSGIRVFDHNRIDSPLGAYDLTSYPDWRIDPSDECPAFETTPKIVFDYPDYNHELQDGPIKAGGKLRIEYDGRRLREDQSCFEQDSETKSTSIFMAWMYNLDPFRIEQTRVEYYQEDTGTTCANQEDPCITQEINQIELDIPQDAWAIDMWFYCDAGLDDNGQPEFYYDSDYNQNYYWPVEGQYQ
jgi:hypothetical protein